MHYGWKYVLVLPVFIFCTLVYLYLDIRGLGDFFSTNIVRVRQHQSKIVKQYLEKNTTPQEEQHTHPMNGRSLMNPNEENKDEFHLDRDYSLPILTMFTSWVPSKEKYLCRNTTVLNWRKFEPYITPILFTNITDLKQRVEQKGWKTLPVIKTNSAIPVLKHMYLMASAHFKSTFYAYANGDILFTESLFKTMIAVVRCFEGQNKTILIVGQRTNVKNISKLQAVSFDSLRRISAERGSLFTPWGVDFFITSANYPWKKMPDVVIGRVAYDNFIILESIRRNVVVIDATRTLLAVHHTTKSGNFEGHSKPNGSLNYVIINHYYSNTHVDFAKGQVICSNYFSDYLKNGTIVINKKTVPPC